MWQTYLKERWLKGPVISSRTYTCPQLCFHKSQVELEGVMDAKGGKGDVEAKVASLHHHALQW